MDPYGLSRGLPPLPHPTTSGLALPSTATAPPPPAKKRRSTWMGVPVSGSPGGEEALTDVLAAGDESRKKRRKSRNGGSWAYVEVEEKREGMEGAFRSSPFSSAATDRSSPEAADLGPGKRRGKIDYALLADSVGEAPVQEQPTARRRAPRSRSTSARPSLPTLETVQEDRDFDPSPPASFFSSSGWTLADDVELVQLAQSFKIDGRRVNWVAVAGRFGGGLRKNSQECEKRWRKLEQEVEEALSGAPFEEEQFEANDDDGWSPALDAALLSAIDSLPSAPIAAYASLDTLLADPSDSNYAATAWETIAGSFEGEVKTASFALPGGIKGGVEPEALYARHQELLHPSPPVPKSQCHPSRRLSTASSTTFSRQLVEKVLALGGRPAFRDAGWEEGVERTARWVQVGVAVGGGRRVAEVVERWDEVRGEVKGKERPPRPPQPHPQAQPATASASSSGPSARGDSGTSSSTPAPAQIVTDDPDVNSSTAAARPAEEHVVAPAVPSSATVASTLAASAVYRPQSAGRTPARFWTTREEDTLFRLVDEGLSIQQISQRINRTEGAIERRIRARKSDEVEKPVRMADALGASSSTPPLTVPPDWKDLASIIGEVSPRKKKPSKTAVEAEEAEAIRKAGIRPRSRPPAVRSTNVSLDVSLPNAGDAAATQNRSENGEAGAAESIPVERGTSIDTWHVSPLEQVEHRNKAPHTPWTLEDEQILRARRAAGDSLSAIGLRLGRTTSAVQSRWAQKKAQWKAAGLLAPTSSSTATHPLPSTLAPSSRTTANPNLLPPSFASFQAQAAQLASASIAALAFTPYRDPAPSTSSRPLLPPPSPIVRPAALSCKSTNLLPTSTLPTHFKPAPAKPPAPFRPIACSSSSSSFAPPAVQPVLSAVPAPTRPPPNVSQQPVQYRPPRLHPLLSRIRRVLEENQDTSDEDD